MSKWSGNESISLSVVSLGQKNIGKTMENTEHDELT